MDMRPWSPEGDRNVVKFFTEIGFEVVRIAGLKCGSAPQQHFQADSGDLLVWVFSASRCVIVTVAS